MAHVAIIDPDGIVQDVSVINNSDLPDDGSFTPEVEAAAEAWQRGLALLPDGHTVRLTSYNNNFRGRYAGIGYRYDEATDEFVPPGWEFIDGEWQDPNPFVRPDETV
jgi:hypothetical protein